jgi:hypothetical protein
VDFYRVLFGTSSTSGADIFKLNLELELLVDISILGLVEFWKYI